LIKDNRDFLAQSELYQENHAIFDNHIAQVSNFAKQFDSNLYLMVINDDVRKAVLKEIPAMK